MLHFLQKYWFAIFVILGALDWLFSDDEAASQARAAEQAAEDEWYAHPMNKDGMNYKE